MPLRPKQLDVGKRISAWRRRHGFSQGAISRRAGIDPSYLSRIENGKVHPTVEMVLRIASGLGVSLSELVQPSPPDLTNQFCPITRSGRCLMDLIGVDGDARQAPPRETYSPQEIKLLRRVASLLHRSSPDVLRAIEVVVKEMQHD